MLQTGNANQPNDGHSRRGWLGETELLEAINEMGYNVSPDELSALRDDIEQFIEDEEHDNCREDEGNISLFSSLRFCDDCPLQHQKAESRSAFTNGSNAVDRYRALNNAEMARRRYLGRNRPTVQQESAGLRKRKWNNGTFFTTADNEHDDLDRNAISDLIYEGYRCMQRLYADNAHLSRLTKRVALSRRGNECTAAQSDRQRGEGTVVEDETPFEEDEESEEAWSMPTYSLIDDRFSRGRAPDVDPSIRPVLCPLPGELPFRHDPVKKFELYQREWRRNPPPGEKKRLSLRWKVREYMLRQDVPRITAEDLAKKRPPNPEWVS